MIIRYLDPWGKPMLRIPLQFKAYSLFKGVFGSLGGPRTATLNPEP